MGGIGNIAQCVAAAGTFVCAAENVANVGEVEITAGKASDEVAEEGKDPTQAALRDGSRIGADKGIGVELANGFVDIGSNAAQFLGRNGLARGLDGAADTIRAVDASYDTWTCGLP